MSREVIERVAKAMALHAGWEKWDTAKDFCDTPSGNDPDYEREYWIELAELAVSYIAGAAKGGSTSDNSNSFAANKATEEGELPALQFDVETSDELTDAQNQSLDNLRTLNELLICFSSWEPQVCVVGNVRAGDSVNAIRAAIAADRASRQVANKAEVEPNGWIATAIIGSEYTSVAFRNEKVARACCVKGEPFPFWKSPVATPPATTGASTAFMPTVLTDERIAAIWHETACAEGEGTREHPAVFARAIEREVEAQAGQVAVPEGWTLVPVEPTDDMRQACRYLAYADHIDDEWAYMLAAAPSPAKESK